ncbi:PREDICTED: uncharacterized protein LOC108758316 [Trachymyrmex cornetzi]|uniref:uncharacterized protein LOC108758316 n=1 Tax=Trachymyrmex cornetzi TaxID=471704 RepID=UPI00084F0522|nr:PREDICTED: uncharacterized protein LOC108758316 [Trachymyrmex cornetzi]
MTSKHQIFVILIIISIVGLISATQVPERKCIPEKQYFDGCNTCFCTSKSTIVCTKKLCWEFSNLYNMTRMAQLLPPPSDFWQ